VETPKHPELKQKMCGLLGRPDGNQTNDFLDCNGVQQTPQAGYGPVNWAFGDSCIVPDNGVWDMKCFRDDADKKFEEHKKNIDPEVEKKIRELCKGNLENPDLVDCAKKAGRTPLQVEACVFDVLFMKSESERKQYIKHLMKAACEKEIEFKDANSCCAKNLVPLYRLYHPDSPTLFYTISTYAASYWSYIKPFSWEGSPGLVALSASDNCGCGGGSFTRINDMNGVSTDRKFGKSCYARDNEMPAYEKEGYKKNTANPDIYCAPTAGQCGATVPLRRYQLDANGKFHVLTTNPKETRGTFVDILCYIWPPPPQTKDSTKMNLLGVKDGDFY